MTPPSILAATLKSDLPIRETSDGVWTVVKDTDSHIVYDSHAALYDTLIGNRLYNRIAWGSSPRSYARFAATALRANHGKMLDAGCGSLVSTAELHIKSKRPTILCDLSAGMLGAARERIIALNGRMPNHLVLLQADIRSLPFYDASFGSVLCPGMLHLFEDLGSVTSELARVLEPDGKLFMSSLVAERWIGRNYLNILHRAGEVAKPRSAAQLKGLLTSHDAGLRQPIKVELAGSMMFVTAEANNPNEAAANE